MVVGVAGVVGVESVSRVVVVVILLRFYNLGRIPAPHDFLFFPGIIPRL